MKHLSILQDIYHLVQQLLKYQRLRYVHKISMQVYQEEMTTTCQEIMRLCTFYQELEEPGPQYYVVKEAYQQYQEEQKHKFIKKKYL